MDNTQCQCLLTKYMMRCCRHSCVRNTYTCYSINVDFSFFFQFLKSEEYNIKINSNLITKMVLKSQNLSKYFVLVHSIFRMNLYRMIFE